MNERGNLLVFLVIGFLAIALIPPIILAVFPPAKLLFQAIMIFVLYSMVRGYMGSGVLTIIITAILVWLLVFKYTYIFASVYVMQMLLMVGFTSVIMWGIGTSVKKH